MHPYDKTDVAEYSRLLASSFKRWTGRPLLEDNIDSLEFSRQLYFAPFVLVSHGIEDDPIFRYANHAAQLLWRSDFESMVRMPSRLTATPDAREERARMLAEAEEKGYVSNYRGTRVTTDGKLFTITDTILWNVVDESGMRHGQAAMFANFEWVDR